MGRLYGEGKLDEAERLLEEVERSLATRPRVEVVDRSTLDAAADEYFCLQHRLHIGWARRAYQETLPHAERAYELEKAIFNELTLPQADTDRLFEAFITEAFTEMEVGRQPGDPDEIYVSVTLVGSGGKHQLGKFGRPEHRRFDGLIGVVRATVGAHVDAARRNALTL